MLSFSGNRRRYSPPSRQYVTMQAMAVYVYCAFLGTWGLMEKDHFPFHSWSVSGLACVPVARDTNSSLFFWLCFIPLFAGIPFAYIGYICYDIRKRQLMPPSGRRRMLTIYFGRLIGVFVIMWIPTFVLLWVAGPWLPPWLHFAGGTWSHLQGAVSAGFSLMKPDILNAVKCFLFCRCGADDELEIYIRVTEAGRRRASSISFRSFSKDGGGCCCCFSRDSAASNLGLSASAEMAAAIAEAKAIDHQIRFEVESQADQLGRSTKQDSEEDSDDDEDQNHSVSGLWPNQAGSDNHPAISMDCEPHSDDVRGSRSMMDTGSLRKKAMFYWRRSKKTDLNEVSQLSMDESVIAEEMRTQKLKDSTRSAPLFFWRRSRKADEGVGTAPNELSRDERVISEDMGTQKFMDSTRSAPLFFWRWSRQADEGIGTEPQRLPGAKRRSFERLQGRGARTVA
ncbi:expressed unknown protein [Seminavis robusta]|uniref:Uncharacterized protein n=1 Tax=Seminavis robusta TaxID=568900 RepID=A0A9N8F2U6_9STRA|nr:expressed unknown protein [Seminavis robusta]|eukprot:Sro3792_g351070.1 n/a (452) ;mRNA; f:2802-4157